MLPILNGFPASTYYMRTYTIFRYLVYVFAYYLTGYHALQTHMVPYIILYAIYTVFMINIIRIKYIGHMKVLDKANHK